MARPIKSRVVDGVVLVDNLYTDNKGRPDHYRYKRPDGSFKHFEMKTVAHANVVASNANQDRHKDPQCPSVRRDSLVFQVPQFIAYREKQDPKLVGKASWINRCNAMRSFAKDFSDVSVNRITRPMLKVWWDPLTFHQKKPRKREFKLLFGWLMGEGLCPQLAYNPFTTNDDHPRLYVDGQKDKARQRLDIQAFWAIYAAAGELGYPGLQIAMGISLTTFMRESDVITMRFDKDLQEDLLKMVIGKSLNQKGTTKAARLKWDVENHHLLKELLKKARELSLKNFRCPYVISHTPMVRKGAKTKDHLCQITPRRLISMFAEARKATGLFVNLPEGATPPTFHEIRSLADKLAVDAGFDIENIQNVMAHEDRATTMGYLEGHQLPYDIVNIVFTEKMIGGSF